MNATKIALTMSWHPNLLHHQRLAPGITISPLYTESLKSFIKSKLKIFPSRRSGLQCVLLALTNAVGHMHKFNLGHFDIKPDNVLIKFIIRGNFNNVDIVLADFGLSNKLINGAYHGHWRGTPHFVCPELNAIKDKQEGGIILQAEKIDVFAMGKTMMEMVSQLNKRNDWERNFSFLITEMTHPIADRRITVNETKRRLQTLNQPADKFDFLPMSKRAHHLIEMAIEKHERRTPTPTLTSTPTATPTRTPTPTATPSRTPSREASWVIFF